MSFCLFTYIEHMYIFSNIYTYTYILIYTLLGVAVSPCFAVGLAIRISIPKLHGPVGPVRPQEDN